MLHLFKTVFKKLIRKPQVCAGNIILFSIICIPPAVISAQHDAETATQTQKIDAEIERREKTAATLEKGERSVIANLENISKKLHAAKLQAATLATKLKRLETQIDHTQQSIDTLRLKIKDSRDMAAQRLVALYKLGRLGRTRIFASSQSIYDLMRHEVLLEHILEHDQTLLDSFFESITTLKELKKLQTAQKAEQLSLESDLNDQIRVMASTKTKRQKLLGEIKSKKSLELAAIEALRRSAAALDVKIGTLGKQKKRKSISDGTFTSYKGLLNLPVKGKIVHDFGLYKTHKYNLPSFRSGIDIRTDMGEPVHTVCGGEILFSDWFQGYGNMIIIDHGDNYYTVYGHAEELFKTKGEEVEIGEVIATAGESGLSREPGLYFEIRHHGKPLDPEDWLKDSRAQ